MGELPGQKISYQAGKLQIMQMLQEARLNQGDEFSVESFHNYVWLNGTRQSRFYGGNVWGRR
jgi:uncharacterized protein (DUF885 family)